MTTLADLGYGNGEDLDDDLVPYVVEIPRINEMVALKHPLLFMVPYTDMMAGAANKQYRQKLQLLAECEAAEAWDRYVYLHEKPYRCETFASISQHLTDAQYWKLLREFWLESENIHESLDAWRALLNSPRRGRASGLMTRRERAALRELPDVITVYRGVRRLPDRGLSWTTDRDKAEWFAGRPFTPGYPAVLVGTVAKVDVFAYLLDRNESEILSDSVRGATCGPSPR
jgi:hypothetical protein